MRALAKLFGQAAAQVVVFLTFFLILGSAADIARRSIFRMSELHWLAGVAVGVIWLMGVVGLYFVIWYAMQPFAPPRLARYVLIRKKEGEGAGLAEQYPTATLSALICVAFLVAMFSMTSVSLLLAGRDIFEYALERSGPSIKPTTEQLFRLYLWHTLDLVPLLNLWQVYDVDPPLRPRNAWAQTAVLICRLAVVTFAISVITQWVRFSRRPANS